MLGLNVSVVTNNNLILGAGASFALRTYNGTSKVYEENIHRLQDYPMDSRDVLSTFSYFTKQVHGVVGYQFGKISVASEWGIAWRLKYWACNANLSGSTVMLPNSNPSGAYFTYISLPNKFLVGANISIPIQDRYGLFLGYNTVEQFKVGVSVRITPNKVINW